MCLRTSGLHFLATHFFTCFILFFHMFCFFLLLGKKWLFCWVGKKFIATLVKHCEDISIPRWQLICVNNAGSMSILVKYKMRDNENKIMKIKLWKYHHSQKTWKFKMIFIQTNFILNFLIFRSKHGSVCLPSWSIKNCTTKSTTWVHSAFYVVCIFICCFVVVGVAVGICNIVNIKSNAPMHSSTMTIYDKWQTYIYI